MNKLNRYDIQKLEDYWINLSKYKKDLKFREWELLNPYQEEERVGSSSGRISDTTGNKAFVLLNDPSYQNLQRIINAVEKIYKTLNTEEKTIVELRYNSINGYYEWEDIAIEIGCSRRKVLMIRNNIIDITAKEIGWV